MHGNLCMCSILRPKSYMCMHILHAHLCILFTFPLSPPLPTITTYTPALVPPPAISPVVTSRVYLCPKYSREKEGRGREREGEGGRGREREGGVGGGEGKMERGKET